jgi:hypothetical protein
MSATSVRLPDSLHENVSEVAQKENILINRIITTAVAETVAIGWKGLMLPVLYEEGTQLHTVASAK